MITTVNLTFESSECLNLSMEVCSEHKIRKESTQNKSQRTHESRLDSVLPTVPSLQEQIREDVLISCEEIHVRSHNEDDQLVDYDNDEFDLQKKVRFHIYASDIREKSNIFADSKSSSRYRRRSFVILFFF